jgi:hypothetical protein
MGSGQECERRLDPATRAPSTHGSRSGSEFHACRRYLLTEARQTASRPFGQAQTHTLILRSPLPRDLREQGFAGRSGLYTLGAGGRRFKSGRPDHTREGAAQGRVPSRLAGWRERRIAAATHTLTIEQMASSRVRRSAGLPTSPRHSCRLLRGGLTLAYYLVARKAYFVGSLFLHVHQPRTVARTDSPGTAEPEVHRDPDRQPAAV